MIVPNFRQKAALESCIESIHSVIDGLDRSFSPELITIDLHEAIEHLNLIIGENVREDLLDIIFNDFCIGK